MQLNTYLTFNGQCEAAFKFYEECLGAKIQFMMTHAEAPSAENVPAEWRNKIMHAALAVGNEILMGSDAPPDHYQQPEGFSVSLQTKDTAEAERIFKAMTKNGKISMPLQQTFWAARFGMLVDQFGIPWMINCEGAGSDTGRDEK